jgi:hypothetical protein
MTWVRRFWRTGLKWLRILRIRSSAEFYDDCDESMGTVTRDYFNI